MADSPATALWTDALDVGDRLIDALEAGDLDAATHALDERQRIVEALSSATLPAPPSSLSKRFRAQDERLRHALDARRQDAESALKSASRVAAAHASYHAPNAPPSSVVDTAPRRR